MIKGGPTNLPKCPGFNTAVLGDGMFPRRIVGGIATSDSPAVLGVAPLIPRDPIEGVSRCVISNSPKLRADERETLHSPLLDRKQQRVRIHHVLGSRNAIGASLVGTRREDAPGLVRYAPNNQELTWHQLELESIARQAGAVHRSVPKLVVSVPPERAASATGSRAS
jgi:hypothetical protein